MMMPIPPAVQQVLDVYETNLPLVKFGDLEATVLSKAAEEVALAATALERAGQRPKRRAPRCRRNRKACFKRRSEHWPTRASTPRAIPNSRRGRPRKSDPTAGVLDLSIAEGAPS
jgi:hypothetical protein